METDQCQGKAKSRTHGRIEDRTKATDEIMSEVSTEGKNALRPPAFEDCAQKE